MGRIRVVRKLSAAAVGAETTAHASATYRLGGGAATAFMGDSITASNDSALNATQADSWITYCKLNSRGSVTHVYNAAIGGQNTTQMLARFATDVVAYAPRRVVILAGTNDVLDGSGGTVGYPSVTKANITAMVQQAKAAGIDVVLATIPPSDTSTYHLKQNRINAWIKRYAASIGAPVLDFYSLLVDPTNGNYRAGYSSDGTHPTAATARLMGEYAAELFRQWFPATPPYLVGSQDNALTLSPNPLFYTDVGADGVPDGWSSYGGTGYAHSLVDDPQVLGKVFRTTRTATDGHFNDVGITTGFSVGDRLALSGIVTATIAAGGMTATLACKFTNATGSPNALIPFTITQDVDHGLFYGEAVVPAGTTALLLQQGTSGGTGTVELGQVTLRNLTAEGIA